MVANDYLHETENALRRERELRGYKTKSTKACDWDRKNIHIVNIKPSWTFNDAVFNSAFTYLWPLVTKAIIQGSDGDGQVTQGLQCKWDRSVHWDWCYLIQTTTEELLAV